MSDPSPSRPSLSAEGGGLRLGGDWRLLSLSRDLAHLRTALEGAARGPDLAWDLAGVTALDSVGALLLWRTWGRRLPAGAILTGDQQGIFARLATALPADGSGSLPAPLRLPLLLVVGALALAMGRNFSGLLTLLGQFALDAAHCLRHPAVIPWREISANLYKTGVQAMPVSALVGFLIGVVLSYLSALQLKAFAAEVYIVNILGLGIVRELGPVLVAVLVAGRSGSAMTAQLGVMRVTEEIDALAIMGVSRSLRLILPKVVALTAAMPLLVLWTIFMGLLGGMVAANVQLDISYGYFIEALPSAVPLANLYIGVGKGAAFGFVIALVACHFGLAVKPNTESLSANTTSSVVTSITAVILLDAVFAIATKELGLPM